MTRFFACECRQRYTISPPTSLRSIETRNRIDIYKNWYGTDINVKIDSKAKETLYWNNQKHLAFQRSRE